MSALRAAAKVAISASFVGCVTSTDELPVRPKSGIVSVDTTVDDDADPETGVGCGETKYPDPDECARITLGLSEVVHGPADVRMPTAELVACCELVLANSDPSPVLRADDRACCYVVGGENWWTLPSAACAPWGPPMPPEMELA
jgi:hypothetical protein